MRLFNNFDLLLGRKTYEIFSAYWPYQDRSGPEGGIANVFDGVTKYVLSRSGQVDIGWQKSVLLRDLDAVKQLKHEAGPDLVTQGSTELIHALFAHDLVDALSVFTCPIVPGSGKQLFVDGSAPRAFKLTRSRVAPSGVVVTHHERDGAVKVDAPALGEPTERELARRERIKREG